MSARKFFSCYQYLGPALLTPLACWLWLRTYRGDTRLVAMAVLLPILYAYIVPAVGTNLLKIWEFDTRFRLGRFRPQHGFVFGSATAMLAWLCHGHLATGWLDVARTALLYACVLGFINLLYDIKAIACGFLRVYNQPWAEGHGAEAIAMDYAPWIFGGFGAVYGVSLAGAEYWLAHVTPDVWAFSGYFLLSLALAIALPVLGYRHHSFKAHGHSGCHPVVRQYHE
jgi:hypothetical protein